MADVTSGSTPPALPPAGQENKHIDIRVMLVWCCFAVPMPCEHVHAARLLLLELQGALQISAFHACFAAAYAFKSRCAPLLPWLLLPPSAPLPPSSSFLRSSTRALMRSCRTHGQHSMEPWSAHQHSTARHHAFD
jgi:hypothetical protein